MACLKSSARQRQLRILTGVDLHQQQLEQRFVGRGYGLVELPESGADELAGRHLAQVAEVEYFVGAYETLGQQRRHILVVAVLLVVRHQPPERDAPAEPECRAVELVEQQVVLGGAAVIGGQPGFALALIEALRIDQKEVRFAALARRPGLQQFALAAQFLDLAGVQGGVVADPHVQIAVLVLRHGAEAAHEEQAEYRLRQFSARRLVGERAAQALCFGELFGVRHEVRESGRGSRRDIAGENRMVDVKQQRQQLEYLLLARRHGLQGPLQACGVDREKARPQRGQHLAVDAFFENWVDVLGAGHCGSCRRG